MEIWSRASKSGGKENRSLIRDHAALRAPLVVFQKVISNISGTVSVYMLLYVEQNVREQLWQYGALDEGCIHLHMWYSLVRPAREIKMESTPVYALDPADQPTAASNPPPPPLILLEGPFWNDLFVFVPTLSGKCA